MNRELQLPPTVNFHLVGPCNFSCRYCFARFEDKQRLLGAGRSEAILTMLAAAGVRRVTFAGGEPTLHRDLARLLECSSRLGLITSLVTNASLVTREWCRQHLPWLRWLVLSCDSHVDATNQLIGRTGKNDSEGQAVRVQRVVEWVHEWNRGRGPADQVHLKINVVVSRANVHEDPSEFLAALRPKRVKLLQCSIVGGENDDARDLACDDSDFRAYVKRVRRIESDDLCVVAEAAAEMHDSYAMIDPDGCFRQARVDKLVSQPILDVGLHEAWRQVGGVDHDLFSSRGGDYDDGLPATGWRSPVIAIEGLDGSGKSTVVEALQRALGAAVVHCPPKRLSEARAVADACVPRERRAWYLQAARAAGDDARTHVFAGVPVVQDRSPASTLAYGAAERGEVALLGDFPRDQLKPDFLLYLDVDETERQRRVGARPAVTDEERRLAEDPEFRSRVIAGYRAMATHVIDANQPIEDVVAAIVALVRA